MTAKESPRIMPKHHYRAYLHAIYTGTCGLSEDEYGRGILDRVEVEYETWLTTGETAKGYWLGRTPHCKDKWVSKASKNRYAYPTKEEALVSLGARTRSRKAHLTRQLAEVNHALSLDLIKNSVN